MKNLSLQEQEQKFISTLICCNNEMSQEYNAKKSYNKNMIQLYESIVGIGKVPYNEITQHNLINFKDFRANKFAYLNSVKKLMQSFDVDMMVNLNESSNFEDDGFNIISFKTQLNSIIEKMSISNDFNVLDSLNPTILKIKVFTKKPIYVYGFDIVNNQYLLEELSSNFGLSINNIYSIIFDKTNKQLLFIFPGRIISYLVNSNEFDDYNNVWKDTWQGNIENIDKIKFEDYNEFVRENINNNIIELYKNPSNFNPKFEDNLYGDKKKTDENLQELMYRKSNLFFKS